MSAKPEDPLDTPVSPRTIREVPVQVWEDGKLEDVADVVAEERPVGLLYQGIPHVVMLASPADLEDLGVGFTLSEGIAQDPSDILSVGVSQTDDSLTVNLGISSRSFAALLRQRRNLAGRTGCGLCGVENVEDAIRTPKHVGKGIRISSAELHAQLAALQDLQPVNARTGSVHAAAWALPGKGIQVVREDVGRHNALDKVIGALVRTGKDPGEGYFIITSRASFEMVQKAAMVGASLVAAVSAPTALAIDVAVKNGVTLVGFARAHRHVIYSHRERIEG
ncbi:MAG TPA: formate dehydrogenase accessory sulfurtransferase FdhD [Steroidobacteraceae bacterium]